jgi:hypothetical protein
MNICFVGDLFLGGDLYYKKDFNPVRSCTFDKSDIRIANLEQPISNNVEIEANKSVIYSDETAINWLKKIKIEVVSLSNNHIQDKRERGIFDTIKFLKSNNINYFGAGINLEEAKRTLFLQPNLAILGYCDFDKSYMRKVTLAGNKKPGVNPLRINTILEDLGKLPADTKAMLYFHWGREHVWFPTYDDISIAKFLLKHEKVAGIIGGHSHKAQGYIRYGQKRAYFSFGNFLFPNFFIKPQANIYYYKEKPKNYSTTKGYHGVSKLTYKKWSVSSRISLMIVYDTEVKKFNHILLKQNENEPYTEELKGMRSKLLLSWIELISFIYTLPGWLYKVFEWTDSSMISILRKIRIYSFLVKQNGFFWLLKKIRDKIHKIINRKR